MECEPYRFYLQRENCHCSLNLAQILMLAAWTFVVGSVPLLALPEDTLSGRQSWQASKGWLPLKSTCQCAIV